MLIPKCAVGLGKSVFGSGRLKSPSGTVPSIHSNIKNTCPDSANYLNKSSGIDKQKNPNIRPNHSSFLHGKKILKTFPNPTTFLMHNPSLGSDGFFFISTGGSKKKKGSRNLGKYQVPSSMKIPKRVNPRRKGAKWQPEIRQTHSPVGCPWKLVTS